MKRNKTAILLCILVVVANVAIAQNFQYKASLNGVPADGFYKIVLGAEVLAVVHTDLRDVRIADDKDRLIPYIPARQQALQATAFSPLPITSNTIDTAGNTILDVENKTNDGIDELSFVIKNTDVQRQLSLSGSNDGSKWFIIREDLLLTPSISYGRDEFIQSVSFPLSSYRHLRFVIRNNKSDGLNIVRAGTLKTNPNAAPKPVYTAHALPFIAQRDSSDGNSYIYIRQEKANLVELLNISITAPMLYERPATLYNLADSSNVVVSTLCDFTVSSKNSREFAIPATVAKQLLLVVYNGDNLPLSVKNVSLAYLPKTVIAYLEKGKSYTMLLGATDATLPNYDLEQFRDSIPGNLATIALDPVQAMAKKADGNNTDNSQAIIWTAIIAGIGVLGLFTYKLVRDMDKQKA